MRKSLEDIAGLVRNIPYPRPLPDELAPLHVYVLDGGHSILCVPMVFLADARAEGCWRYEVPLPVRYVLDVGWKPIEGTDSVSVDVPYDMTIGAMVPPGYEEYEEGFV